jgi:hypothetical protein
MPRDDHGQGFIIVVGNSLAAAIGVDDPLIDRPVIE